jgi:hypothetical protein
MADETGTPRPAFSRRLLGPFRAIDPELAALGRPRAFEGVTPVPFETPTPAPAEPGPAPVSPMVGPSLPVMPAPLPTPPQAPPANPFAELTFPSPGDRIKAEDFRRLAQALRTLADTYALSGATFGYPFGQVKLALAAQQYEVVRVVSVYGAELPNAADTSLDDRKVIQVAPVVLGERRVSVVVTEAADTRRTMPDLTGLTYRQAIERIQSQLGDVIAGGGPMVVPQLEGLSLTEAARRVSG